MDIRIGRPRRAWILVGRKPPVRQWIAVGGMAVGMGMMTEYLLDPQRGRARRATVRDKVGRTARDIGTGADALAADVAHRTRGVSAGARYRFKGRRVEDARVLHERVRAELGRHVRHPHAVDVRVEGGVITLTGDVLAEEETRAQRAVRRIPGVRRVRVHWAVWADSAGISALQGEGRPRESVPELLQQHWSPTARLLVSLGAVVTWTATRRMPRPAAWPLRGVSAALATRAATNLPLKRLTGVRAGCRAVDVEDTIVLAAPSEKVWPWISGYDQFRQIMPDVRHVERTPGSRTSRWVITGPAGVPVRFTAEETRREEGRKIAWKTVDGELIAHAGTVRLDPMDGRTRLQVRLSYNPVVGAVGHAVAALFRADPKHKLHGDLRRLKELVETDTPPPG